MKKIISLLLILSFCVTLFACDNGSEIPDETDNGDWEYVLPTPVVNADVSLPFTSADSFNPYKSKSKLNRKLIPLIYEALYSKTEDGYGYPQLALSANEAGNIVTIKLKQGIVFSDGTPFNAENVKYSYEFAKKNAYYQNNLKNITEFKVVDNFTLKITFKGAMLSPLNCLSFPIVLKSGNVFLGTGKYVLKYLESTPYFEVNKNNSNYNPQWNKQIALYDMAGSSSEVYAFKANKVSVYENDLTDGAYENLSSKTVSIPTNNLVYAGLNMKWAGSITSVAWIRRVINIGINRVDIGAASFLGQTEPTTTPFKPAFYKLSEN
jgi:peptide/nickel transport system substrate-binding protein